MYQDKETGHMHFTREDLMSDLEKLQTFYDVFGKEKIINWMLKKETCSIPIQENKANPENVEEISTCTQNMPHNATDS